MSYRLKTVERSVAPAKAACCSSTAGTATRTIVWFDPLAPAWQCGP
jgi:hypothetical protein